MNETIFNKKASFDFNLSEKLEAGIVLTGSEVKSVRSGSVSLSDSFVKFVGNEALLVNVYIAPYKYAVDPSYDPKRSRKLLLNRDEIEFLAGKVGSGKLTNSDLRSPKGLTIVPVKMYNTHNLVKVEIAIASKKKKFDKRESLKKKAQDRETEGYLRTEKKNSQRD